VRTATLAAHHHAFCGAKKVEILKANKEVLRRREGSKIDALAACSKFVNALLVDVSSARVLSS
jgi:hypothetical protein